MSDGTGDKINRLRSAMYSRQVAPTFGEEKRRALPKNQIGIKEDWQAREGTSADGMTVGSRAIRYTRKALWWVFGLAISFFVVSAGIFGWYVLGGFGTGVRSNNIDIEVRGPLSVVGGEPVELEIIVTNKNKAPLEYADLVITYPAGTRSVTDFVTDLPQQRIPLGRIEAGETKQGTVSAVLVGQGGQESEIKIEVEYQVAGATAIFAASDVYDFAFSAAPVSIILESKTEVVPGQPVELKAIISSNTSSILKGVLLEFEAPFGFTLTSASPIPVSGTTWSLGDLRPGDSKTINLIGNMKGQSGDERVFRFSVGTAQDSEGTSIGIPIAQAIQQVKIKQPFIGLSLDINGESGRSAAVAHPGEEVSVFVNWNNELSTPIKNAVIVASLDGLAVSQTSIRTTDGFYKSVDNTIQWDGQTTSGVLRELAPGSKGVLRFSFVVPTDLELLGKRNPSMNISIHATADRNDEGSVPESLISSAVRTVKVGTTPTVVSQGFYHTNPYGVEGVVPPVVNKETAYAILWTIGNSTNPIEEGVFSARLPAYVEWKGITSPSNEDITFDPKTRTVVWKVGAIPAGVGESGNPAKQASFEIGFIPSASQVGQSPSLLTNTEFRGTDAFTGVQIEKTIVNTTTIQPNDPGFVSSDSKVVQ